MESTTATTTPHDGVDDRYDLAPRPEHLDQYALDLRCRPGRTMPYRAIASTTMTSRAALDVLEVPATTNGPEPFDQLVNRTPSTSTPATIARWSRRSHDGVDDHRDQYALEVRLE